MRQNSHFPTTNEHLWLAQDSDGHVIAYILAEFVMIILDLIQYEKECDTIMKDRQEKSKDRTNIV